MVELKGVIPAITTPFNEDGSLDLDGFRKLVDIIIEDGVHGIVPNGCTGESWALSDDERAEIFKATVEVTAGRIPVVPGCGAMSAADAIHKVHQAEAAGCDAVMIQPPWYVMPGLDEIFDYYKKIIDATDLPIMAYNIPRRTGICFTADFVDQLADEEIIARISADRKHLVATTWDDGPMYLMTNTAIPCLHAGPTNAVTLEPGAKHRWRGRIFLTLNNPANLLKQHKKEASK